MSHNTRQRRLAALRACDRILSGIRPTTMRDRLADMDAGGDLDDQPDFYGDGPVETLEERVAELLGTEAAVFFPTGTMAQQVALRSGADRSGHPTVALHPLGHLEVDERHAYAHLSGLRSTWPTTAPRNPTAEEIIALAEPVSTVVIELPLRDAGFVRPSWDELAAASAAARAIGARPHSDGARIWESTPHLAHTPARSPTSPTAPTSRSTRRSAVSAGRRSRAPSSSPPTPASGGAATAARCSSSGQPL